MSRLPLALGEDRLRLLYRLPLTGAERAVLALHDGVGEGPDWPGLPVESLALARFLAEPDRESQYDAVFLPGITGRPHADQPARTARQLIETAARALKPGGMLVAHLDHGVAPRQLWRGLKHGQGLAWLRRLAGFETAARCTASLRAFGFTDAECYYIEPHADDPGALISSQPQAAKAHFVRTVRRNRPLYSRGGYGVRALCAHIGLGGLLQPHLFLWARKRC